MNIVLIGYRCSGKTTLGKLLVSHLKMKFVDTDHLIEAKTGLPIPSYVSQNGWKDFRVVERKVIEEVAAKDNIVIATGGGVVVDMENVKNLRKNGWVVWLDTEVPVIRERMKNAQNSGELRPPLSGTDPLDEIDAILKERRPFYERASYYRVDTNRRPPQKVLEVIMGALPQCHKNSLAGGG